MDLEPGVPGGPVAGVLVLVGRVVLHHQVQLDGLAGIVEGFGVGAVDLT